MLSFDKPDEDRKKFDEIGQKIWQLHLDLVKLKSQIDDQIVTLDENHMHLGFDNKIAGNIVTGLNNNRPETKPIALSKTHEKTFRKTIHTGQDVDAENFKHRFQT